MGRVTVDAKIENLRDLWDAERSMITSEQVRSLDVADALVDTGASTLAMPKSLIDKLGLQPIGQRSVRTANGSRMVTTYDVVRLTIQGRDCRVDVTDLPEDCPVLVGQIPLEMLDFVVDPNGRRLIGNPEHGGKWMYDMF